MRFVHGLMTALSHRVVPAAAAMGDSNSNGDGNNTFLLEFHRQKVLDPHGPNWKLDKESTRTSPTLESFSSPVDILDTAEWNEYSVKLSMALCSFLRPPKEIRYCPGATDVSQIYLSISLAYWEQCARWIIKVLSTVFPCIKACVSETELPNHIRILANTLQHTCSAHLGRFSFQHQIYSNLSERRICGI